MKKTLAVFILAGTFIFNNCGDKKSEKNPKIITVQPTTETKKVAVSSSIDPALVAQGQQLFKDKTCFTCHMPDTKVIGPSIKEINKIYSEKNADIIAFLKSESKPIVDLDPGQVTIMKANLEGFVKDLSDDQLKAIKAYMQSVN